MMGMIIDNQTMTAQEILHLPSPVIMCANRSDVDKAITDDGYQTVSLNLPLARALAGLTKNDIQSVINDKIYEVLPQAKFLYLTDYEMIFNPDYSLDIPRLFIHLSRRSKLIVKWCGTIDDDALVYAESGYEDYKKYKINDYEIRVVQ